MDSLGLLLGFKIGLLWVFLVLSDGFKLGALSVFERIYISFLMLLDGFTLIVTRADGFTSESTKNSQCKSIAKH